MTIPEMLLITARELGAEFTLEDLAVEARCRFPRHFSLAGYPDHADNKKVSSALSGKAGLVQRGYFVKTAPRRFMLSKTMPPARSSEKPNGKKTPAAGEPCVCSLPPGIERPTQAELATWREGRRTLALIMHHQRMAAIGRAITPAQSRELFEREEVTSGARSRPLSGAQSMLDEQLLTSSFRVDVPPT